MTEQQLHDYILSSFPREDDTCEWKEMKNLKNSFANDEGKDVISYVSAIANMEGGHLVIGVRDKTLDIVGTDLSKVTFNGSTATPESATFKLIEHCTNLSSEGLSIDEITTEDTHKTIWIIHIPKHMARRPVYAHKKAWQRIKDSLVSMTIERMNTILSEPIAGQDWSAEIIPDATIDDLDPKAIRIARDKFKELYPTRTDEIDSWNDITFLNKAHITRQGKITNAAIIILGKEESSHFISPAVCQIRWQLKDGSDENKDFRILSIPMILAVEEFEHLVRNANYTYTISGSMFPESMNRYDVFTLREPLCNCIAHQDYNRKARIEIIENEDESLMFRNYGKFLPSSIEAVVQHNFPESEYRNPFLVEAMRNVKMVETEGGGIRKLYLQQKKRFFPMPIYDISEGKVVCKILGNVIDENFARILVNNPSLTLSEIILLDKVQKHLSIPEDLAALLKAKGYIEGRRPMYFLSSKIADASMLVSLKTSYIKNKSFDDDFFKNLIVNYLKTYKKATRKEIDVLLQDKLSDMMSDKQKYSKVSNLLSLLRREGKIKIIPGKFWTLDV